MILEHKLNLMIRSCGQEVSCFDFLSMGYKSDSSRDQKSKQGAASDLSPRAPVSQDRNLQELFLNACPLAPQKEVVYKKKESFFSLEEATFQQPGVLVLQVWDYDRIGANDFLGETRGDWNVH